VKQDAPCVVIAKQNNALVIYALDDLAARSGLSIGLPLANARAICPELIVFDADEAADRKTLDDIADWCDRFTPLVALDPPHGLYLDITGCAHLFGGEAALLRMVSGALTQRGFAVSSAIASTSVCARTLTRHVSGKIIADGEEAASVAPLPVSALGAGEAIAGGLRRAGLKTIGDVASRARHEIAARFGAGFTAHLEHALGEGDAPISPRKPLPDYIVEKRFPEPVATENVIAANLSALAAMLVAAMDKQGKGARRLEAGFFRTDGAVRTIAVDTGRPVTRREVIDRLFRERLEALNDPLDPGFGFDLIRLSASRTEIMVQQQRDLDASVHDNDELAALMNEDRFHKPRGWKLSPRAVEAFIMGADKPVAITPKYIGDRYMVQVAIATLAERLFEFESENANEGVGLCLAGWLTNWLAVGLSERLTFPPTKLGLPPNLPASALTLRSRSSLTILRLKIAPCSSREKTPADSNSASRRFTIDSGSPISRANCAALRGDPLMVQ